MICKKCSAPMSDFGFEALGVKSAVCTSGHRIYIFKRDNGAWETQEERMERMKVWVKCPKCKKEHLCYEQYFESKERTCDECWEKIARRQAARERARILREFGLGRERKQNPTPWRLYNPMGFGRSEP